MKDLPRYFSTDYVTARARFTQAASTVGAVHQRYNLSADEDNALSVDTAIIGNGDALLIVSSGLHGVEGFLGSALQLAMLDRMDLTSLPCRLLLIHALNPWGFHHLRRVDENNVDLNRNFPNTEYKGAPDGYRQLNTLLNPDTAGAGLDFFRLRAIAKILRFGMPALKDAVASGQYEFPGGLFYGGSEVTCATRLFTEHIQEWIGGAKRVCHLDVHSGLGKHAECKLLIPEADTGEIASWCLHHFDKERIEVHGSGAAMAYPVSGMLGDWLLTVNSNRPYYFVGAEVGTYSPISVLRSLREENRQHFYGIEGGRTYDASKRDLLERFCPASPEWRRRSMSDLVAVVEQAIAALQQDSESLTD